MFWSNDNNDCSYVKQMIVRCIENVGAKELEVGKIYHTDDAEMNLKNHKELEKFLQELDKAEEVLTMVTSLKYERDQMNWFQKILINDFTYLGLCSLHGLFWGLLMLWFLGKSHIYIAILMAMLIGLPLTQLMTRYRLRLLWGDVNTKKKEQ